MAEIINQFADISNRYDAIFCDLWGVVHNGQEPFVDAVAALMQARLDGRTVVFVTNSPRTPNAVKRQLTELGIPERAYDGIATGGGVMQNTVFSIGLRSYYFIGRDEDRELFTDLPNGVTNSMVEVDIDNADCVIVAGPDYETRPSAQDYEIELRKAHNRKLPMYNANADRVVDHGETRIECGGAIAQLYIELGGTVFEFGKPFSGIYEAAQQIVREVRGRKVSSQDTLVIGDSISTDIKGAMLENFDSLLVTNGLHAADIPTDTNGMPNPTALQDFLNQAEYQPQFAMSRLR